MAVSSSLHDLSPYVLSVLVMLLLLLLLLAHHLLVLLVTGHMRTHNLQLMLLLARLVEAAVRVGADTEVSSVQVFDPNRAVVGVRCGCILAVVRGREACAAGRGASCGLKVLKTASEDLFMLDLIHSNPK